MRSLKCGKEEDTASGYPKIQLPMPKCWKDICFKSIASDACLWRGRQIRKRHADEGRAEKNMGMETGGFPSGKKYSKITRV